MKTPTLTTQILTGFFGGSVEAFTAFATTPKFRGPTPERTTRPRGRGENAPMTRAMPKPASRRDKHRAAVAARARPTQPKFSSPRQRKQHVHPLRDEHGAVTLAGRPHPWLDANVLAHGGRRVWLAGVSAQRGY